MIRLNDINKTAIDEKEIKGYGIFTDSHYDRDKYIDVECIILYTGNISMKADYETKEARDKDIELLDKIFDVKDIEYKAMSVEKPTGCVNDMKPKIELVSEGEYDLVKKEEYITWDYVKQFPTTYIKALLPNEKIVFIKLKDNYIRIYDEVDGVIIATIYSEDLFDSLRLKEVK